MNRIACMPDISLGLVDRSPRASQLRHYSDTGAVEAEMRQTNPLEELMPFFCWVFGKLDQNLPLRAAGMVNQRDQVDVQRRRVSSPSFRREGDRPGFKVDSRQRHGSFRQSATLSHRDEPAFAHPFRSRLQFLFDLRSLFIRDFWLLFGWRPFQAETHAWIRCDVTAPYSLLHDRRKDLEFGECSIQRSGTHQLYRRAGPKGGIIDTEFIGDLRRRNQVQVLKIGRHCGPRIQVARKRLRVGITLAEESRHPGVKAIRIFVPPELLLLQRLSGNELLELPSYAGCVDTELGGLRSPSPVRILNAQPVKRTSLSSIGGCHTCNMV